MEICRERRHFLIITYICSTWVFIEQAFEILREKLQILNHIDIQNMEEILKYDHDSSDNWKIWKL